MLGQVALTTYVDNMKAERRVLRRAGLHRIPIVVVQGAHIVYDGFEGLLAQRTFRLNLQNED